jgi:phosphatidate phosphatase APP1
MILDLLPDLSFLLIGDNGQEDPQIYQEVALDYPGRILGVYIRDVSGGRKRIGEMRQIKEAIESAGSKFVVTSETGVMARHAVEQGWIV